MNEPNFEDIFTREPMPEKLQLNRRAFYNFTKIGGRGLAIIVSDEEWGPVVKYYYLRKSKLVSKLLENKSLPVELSIAGKYAEEIIMKDGSRVILFTYETPSEAYERKKLNYIAIEVSPDIDIAKIKPLLTKLKNEIKRVKRPNKSLLRKILIRLLDKYDKTS